MINLFSLETFFGLLARILIGWLLKNIFSKKENVGDLASNLKSLENKIDNFQNSNATERGSIKNILQDIDKINWMQSFCTFGYLLHGLFQSVQLD